MPKAIILGITHDDKGPEFLRSLSKSSRLASRCSYIGTYDERFVLCREFSGSKYVYYAVDRLTGKFSRICESSLDMSAEVIARSSGRALMNAVKYTGVFNRIRVATWMNPAMCVRWMP